MIRYFTAIAMMIAAAGCGGKRTAGYETLLPQVNAPLRDLEVMQGEDFLRRYDSGFRIQIVQGDAPGTLGLSTLMIGKENCVIELSSDALAAPKSDKFRHILYHEIGHCFGLSHSGKPGDIMYRYYSTSYPEVSDKYEVFNALLTKVRQEQ